MKKETTRLIVRGMLFALYLAMGMIVFRVLEAPNEQQGILKAKKAIAHVLTKCNISQQELRKLVEIITEAEHWGFTTGWLEKWSYTGALFFSGTVITTIGALTVCVCKIAFVFKKYSFTRTNLLSFKIVTLKMKILSL